MLGILMFLSWVYIALSGLIDTQINYIYGVGLGIMPIVASFFGFFNGYGWGGSRSAMGKTLYFLSAGLLMWGIGTLIFAYYNIVLKVLVPYPSIADGFYIISWPLWGLGMFYLSKATGAKFGLQRGQGKTMLLLIPAVIITLSYYLLVVVARGGELDLTDSGLLKIFFDLFYPIGDVVILTIATLIFGLSYSYLGGKFRPAIYLILLGFVMNYFSDFLFSYTTTSGTFYTGNWVDFLFTITMFVLATGITMLDPRKTISSAEVLT